MNLGARGRRSGAVSLHLLGFFDVARHLFGDICDNQRSSRCGTSCTHAREGQALLRDYKAEIRRLLAST